METRKPLSGFNAWIEEARQDGRLPKIVGVAAVVMVFAGAGLTKLLWSPSDMVKDTARTGVSWLGRHEKAEDLNEQREMVIAHGGRFQAAHGDSTSMVLWGRKAKPQAAAGSAVGAAAAPRAAATALGGPDEDDADDAPDPDVLPQALSEQEGRQPLMTSAPLSVPAADAGKAGPMAAAPAPAPAQDPAAAAAVAAAAKLQKAGERAYRAAAAGNTAAAGAIARTALRENRGLLRGSGVALPTTPDGDVDPEAAAAAAQGELAPAIGRGGDEIRATAMPGGAAGPVTQVPGAKTGAPAATANAVGGGGGGGGGGGSGGGSGAGTSGSTMSGGAKTRRQTDPAATTTDTEPGTTDPEAPVQRPRLRKRMTTTSTYSGATLSGGDSTAPAARFPRARNQQ